MESSHKITSRQLMTFIITTQVGIGVITLPSILAKEIGHDGWISVILTGVGVIVCSMLILMLLRRYEDKSIYDITKLIFGRYPAFFLNLFILIYLVIAAAIGVRMFAEFVRLTLFINTPELLVMIFIMLPSIYLVWCGLKPICRIHGIIYIILMLVLIYFLCINKNIRLNFLLPIGQAGIVPIISSMKSTFFAYVGFELIVIIYPFINDKKKIFRYYIGASLVSIIFFSVTTAVVTAVFGENLLEMITIPLFSLARIYNAPILERVDLYFILVWFIAVECSLRGYLYAAYYSANKILGLPKKKIIYAVYLLLIGAISKIPGDINQTFELLEVINIASMVVILFIILCGFLSFIFKRGVKS